jgi:hypothetical protein
MEPNFAADAGPTMGFPSFSCAASLSIRTGPNTTTSMKITREYWRIFMRLLRTRVKSGEEIVASRAHNLSKSSHKIQFLHFASSRQSDALAFAREETASIFK